MKKRGKIYFLKQKLIGVFLLMLTVIAVILLEGDATIALVTVPIGLMLIFTKKRYWMDDYYFEMEGMEDEESIYLQSLSGSYGLRARQKH